MHKNQVDTIIYVFYAINFTKDCDVMDTIFAPWRMQYVLSNSKENSKNQTACIFCDFPKRNEEEKFLILRREKLSFVIMNAFPYNSGHLMVVPYRHTADMTQLTFEETSEMTLLAQTAVSTLKSLMNPDGFNIGMNLGKAAGAGIDQHLHIHIVPRWNGDTNFMPVIGNVKVVSEALTSTWKRLKAAWPI